MEEQVTAGSTTTTYTYYYLPDGTRLGEAINNGSLFVLATDLLGTSQTTLLANGTSTASALYSPYGSARYASGSMPTDYAFTGQHSDLGTSGLDNYNARYYDPTAAQFGAADTVLDGMAPPNRFGYVAGNPESATDPSGHVCYAALCGPGSDPGANDYILVDERHDPWHIGRSAGTAPACPYDVGTCMQVRAITVRGGIDAADPWHLRLPGRLILNEAHDPLHLNWAYATTTTPPPPPPPRSHAGGADSGPDGGGGGDDESGSGDRGMCGPSGGDNHSGNGGEENVTLYHVSGPREFNDLLRFGDYDQTPTGIEGKYFARTEEGAWRFGQGGFKAGGRFAISRIQIPQSVFELGEPFNDAGPTGAGPSVFFPSEVLPQLYDAMGLPEIIAAPWIRDIGC